MKASEAVLGQEVVVPGHGVGRVTALGVLRDLTQVKYTFFGTVKSARTDYLLDSQIGVTPYSAGYQMIFNERNVEPWPRPAPAPSIQWKNGCNLSIPKALRYLAENDRPTGGQQHFNAEHLYQLANEFEETIRVA